MNNDRYSGLTNCEVVNSRTKWGDNILTPPPKPSLWLKFFEKFSDPIIVILLVALTLSVGVAIYHYVCGQAAVSVFLEPVGIFVAVVSSTLIGFVFESRAAKKFEILNRVDDSSMVRLRRDGVVREFPKSEVVVGDIMLLESGEEIAADCRLLEAVALQVNESSLTGEPLTHKSTLRADFDTEATYPTDHVMRGTTVVEGYGVAIVESVGDKTEWGKVYRGAQVDNGVKTPLGKQLDSLASLISKVSYGVATLILIGRLWIYFAGLGEFVWIEFGGYLLNTIMLAVTVVVVSVPEGLPMSVTLSLTLNMQRMLRANNLVRKMHACETMGAVTVICTDKTGTLTQNKMQVYETRFFESRYLEESIAVNSTAHIERVEGSVAKVLGNPTEGALLLWLEQQGVDYLSLRESSKVIAQLSFSTERKYMATVVQGPTPQSNIIFIKGAPEVILSLAGHNERTTLETLEEWQTKAMRTLSFAYAQIDACDEPLYEITNAKFILQGVVAISDPIRDEVPVAINSCQAAGISVKIVTGDTSATAKEIGRQIGLWNDDDTEYNHLTGVEFEELSDEELLSRIKDLKIMSRARPMDKQRLVELLQQLSEVVAVTGDGTNDAPALKAAQIGLSMGDGTSVAKEASDITIVDNSFGSIVSAVVWGRSLYKNIQRFVMFQLTINVVACAIVLIGAFTGSESPLTVTQMLWVNLIMDTFAALALASLPPSEKVLRAAPRRAEEHIITPSMAKTIVGSAVLFVFFLFGLMQYFRSCDVVSLGEFSVAQYCDNYFNFSNMQRGFSVYELSLFFTIFVVLQFWNLFNAKTFLGGESFFRSLRCNYGFVIIALLILVGQWLIVTYGGEMFGVVAISVEDWLIIVTALCPILLLSKLQRTNDFTLREG